MKAWFAREYGGPEVLRLEDQPTPRPGVGQVLIRVHATTVNSGDVRIRGCDFPTATKLLGRLALGWTRPRQPILGTELSGRVEAVGRGVRRFAVGDAVFAFVGIRQRAHAEYVLVSETGAVAHLPAGVDFATGAALCFGGTTALHYLRKAKVGPGETMLVLGGSGAVGVAMIQLARFRGAVVTATTSTRNVELAATLGAELVLDYTRIDIAALPDRFDIIADTIGAMDFSAALPLLKPNGRYLAIAGALKEMAGSLRRRSDGRRMIAGPAAERLCDILELGRLASDGHYRPYIDRLYEFPDMQVAHAYVDTGRKRGSVVVVVSS